MKVASSSASFARAIAAGDLVQLEWLDVCANELEVDGVVFDAAQFPRTDGDYLAQLKKVASDLGLAVAGVAADEAIGPDGGRWRDVALMLGAPLVIAGAPQASNYSAASAAFTEAVKVAAHESKSANVTLALRNRDGTLCANAVDLARIAKDVDSAWLRYALDPSALDALDDPHTLLGRSVIAIHPVATLDSFATSADKSAPNLVEALARFRGFVVLEGDAAAGAKRDAYHAAMRRFQLVRERHLEARAYAG